MMTLMTIMKASTTGGGGPLPFTSREDYYSTLTAFPKVPLMIVGSILLVLVVIVWWLQPDPPPPLELLQDLLLPAMLQTLPSRTSTHENNDRKEDEEESLIIHLIVLVPGLLSPPTGMGNTKLFLDQLSRQYNYCSTATGEKEKKHMIIYRANSNLGRRTTDGVMACGKRLAEEINIILDGFQKQQQQNNTTNNFHHRYHHHHPAITKINLSLIGNSLGGLISRAALPHIHWNDTTASAGIQIIPKLFSTTSTPHLGSKHCSTVVIANLPTALQKIGDVCLAKIFGKTGQDLFWFSNTIELLNTNPIYLKPLSQFEQRIAYGNSFRTDLQVPTASSLFLCKTLNDSIHQTILSTTKEFKHYYFDTYNFPFVVHALRTTTKTKTDPTKQQQEQQGGYDDDDDDNRYHYHKNKYNNIDDWMKLYCHNLDSLGWIKVFCDTRPVLPYLPIPSLPTIPILPGLLRAVLPGPSTTADPPFLLERLDRTPTWTSSCLYYAYHCQNGQHLYYDDDDDNNNDNSHQQRWYPPMAHNVLMATMSTIPTFLGGEYFTKRGIPFVEEYAKRIVQQCTTTTTTMTPKGKKD